MKSLQVNPKSLVQGRIGELYNTRSLSQFAQEHPFIDCLRKQAVSSVLGNDAFEISWNIQKANFVYDKMKAWIDNWSMIDHDQILKQKKLE